VFFFHKTRSLQCEISAAKAGSHERADYKGVIEEFFFRLYYQSYKENGMSIGDVHDPQLLALLGLPPYAGLQDVKKRFRELAMLYHPDHGGDGEKFLELMDTYVQITGGRNNLVHFLSGAHMIILCVRFSGRYSYEILTTETVY